MKSKILSNVFFYLGDIFSKLAYRNILLFVTFRAYQYFMSLSVKYDDGTVWEKINK